MTKRARPEAPTAPTAPPASKSPRATVNLAAKMAWLHDQHETCQGLFSGLPPADSPELLPRMMRDEAKGAAEGASLTMTAAPRGGWHWQRAAGMTAQRARSIS